MHPDPWQRHLCLSAWKGGGYAHLCGPVPARTIRLTRTFTAVTRVRSLNGTPEI